MPATGLKVVSVVGTRPELIRLSRVLALLDKTTSHVLVHTGQNYDDNLKDVFFRDLELRAPDHYLGIGVTSIGVMLGEILIGIEAILDQERPDAVLVLGDTNSSIAGLIAKRMRIPLYHMEAGNRCFDLNVPEEVNRRLVDHIADFNLVYTEHARRNLLAEGLPPRRIYLTGSPLFEVLTHYRPNIEASTVHEALGLTRGEYYVVSMHRQENVDDPGRLRELVAALARLAYADRQVVVSTHPRTRERLEEVGATEPRGVRFLPPFGFNDYNALQLGASCVLSDSGSVSEESLILGFPAVTMRESIERPEALDAGGIVTTGVNAEAIVEGVAAAQAMFAAGRDIPAEYRIANCAERAVNLILSTARLSNGWDGIRS